MGRRLRNGDSKWQGRLLKQLFESYQNRDDKRFRAAAEEIIEEERKNTIRFCRMSCSGFSRMESGPSVLVLMPRKVLKKAQPLA